MEAFSDPRYSRVVVVCGSQMGKTEVIFNVMGHRLDDGPYVPVLYIGPTQKQVSDVSEDRVDKMLLTTPALWSKLEKGQRDKKTAKYIAGVRLSFGWAGSATELASKPNGLVFADEVDRFDADVSGEGDPVELAAARTKNYPNAKLGIFSTPTIQGASAVWSYYEEGTMFKWAWRCPECADWFIPHLALLLWPKGATPTEALDKAHVACPECGAVIETRQRNGLNDGGRFIPHVLGPNGEHVRVDDEPRNTTASFWVSGLASPWRSFGQIAERLLKAYNSKEPGRIQSVINTEAGELYTESGDAPDIEEIYQLRADYPPRVLPDEVQLITAGVDVQKYGLYFVVRGWGYNGESWLLDHGFIAGETEYDNAWIQLNRVISQDISGRSIQRAFIDSGYRPGDKWRRPENQVYLYCRRHAGQVFPTKGHDTLDQPLKAKHIDVNVSGRIVKNGLQLWHIDTDHLKSWIYARLRWPEGERGAWHIYNDVDDDYCRQLIAEELVIKPSGKRVWIRRNKDNHYLDCEANALAAAISLQVHRLRPRDPDRQPARRAEPERQQDTRQAQRRSPFKRRDSFLGR